MQGLADKIKHRQFFKYFHKKLCNVIFLQETHSTKKLQKIWQNEWSGKIIFANGSSNAKGVAINKQYNKQTMFEESCVERDDKGRFILCQGLINDASYLFVNVYALNEDEPNFFVNLFDKITEKTADYVIVGGDMNKVLNNKMDKRGGKENVTQSANVINTFLNEYEWSDVWRDLHPGDFQFTWKRRQPLVMARLDYFFIPIGILSLVDSCKILPAVLSDHCPVIMEIITSEQIKGPGYWKFNTRHSHSKVFLDECNKIIDYAEYRYSELNPLHKWEMIKHDLREFAIQYSREQASIKKKEIEKWNRQLKALYTKLAVINLSAPNVMSI